MEIIFNYKKKSLFLFLERYFRNFWMRSRTIDRTYSFHDKLSPVELGSRFHFDTKLKNWRKYVNRYYHSRYIYTNRASLRLFISKNHNIFSLSYIRNLHLTFVPFGPCPMFWNPIYVLVDHNTFRSQMTLTDTLIHVHKYTM